MATLKAEQPQAFPYPGIPGTGDGSDAVSYVETRATDGAAAYPITSSTIMGQLFQVAVAGDAGADHELPCVKPENLVQFPPAGAPCVLLDRRPLRQIRKREIPWLVVPIDARQWEIIGGIGRVSDPALQLPA